MENIKLQGRRMSTGSIISLPFPSISEAWEALMLWTERGYDCHITHNGKPVIIN